jgi:hypothetical protein
MFISAPKKDAKPTRIPRGHFGRPGFGGPGGMGFGFGFGFGRLGLMAGVEDVATYLGLKPADLATQLSEVEAFIAYAAIAGGHVDGILGSRIYKLGSKP